MNSDNNTTLWILGAVAVGAGVYYLADKSNTPAPAPAVVYHGYVPGPIGHRPVYHGHYGGHGYRRRHWH